MAIKTFPIKLQWAKMLTPTVRHLAFRREDGEPFEYIPGQFITIHIAQGEKILRRSYSIATIPNENDLIEFALGYVDGGIASEMLFSLEPGTILNVSGPHGRLILRDEQPKRYILVATSTGVTPYRTMLPTIEKRLATEDLHVHLLLGVRAREDLLFADEFRNFANKNTNFTFNAYYSRETMETLTNPLEDENIGYVHSAFENLHLDPSGDLIYLCGNPSMIDDAVALLKAKEFTIQQLRREKYIS